MRALYAILILCLGLLCACGRKTATYPEAMTHAIRCMNAAPDSALLYLGEVSDSMLSAAPEETRMYYDLLTIKAHDKLYHPHTSDSVILAIVRFYDEYGDPHKRMEAYHYLGSVYRDLGDAPRAIKAFQEVAKLGEHTTEYDLLAKAYGQIGTLLHQQGLEEQAEQMGRKELEYGMLQGDSVAVGFALRNIARTFRDRNQADSALFYYLEGYRRGASQIKNILLTEVPGVYNYLGDTEKAKELIFELFEAGTYSGNIWYILGKIYLQEGDLENAYDCFTESLKKPSLFKDQRIYQLLFEIEKRRNNMNQATLFASKSFSLMDSVNQVTQTETVGKIQSLYDFQRYEEENNRLKATSKQHQLWIFILVLSMLLIVALGSIYYNWLQRKRKKILRLARTSLLMNELAYSRSSIYTHEEIEWIKKMEKEDHKIMDEKDFFQKRLYEAEKELSVYENKGNAQIKDEKGLRELSLRKSTIYRFFREWNVETCGNITQDKWDELRMALDTVYPRFTDRLLLLYPKLSEQELRICYLIKIGVNVKTIALMLNKSISAITNARTRMDKKLRGEEGKAEQFDQFIADI